VNLERVQSPLSEERRQEDLPTGWAWACLRDVARPSGEKTEPADHPDTPYLSLEHVEAETTRIVGRGIGSDVRSTKSVFRAGDVLYGKLRPYLNKVCIPPFDGICFTDFLVFPQSQHLDSRILMWYLNRRELVEFAAHQQKGVELPRVNYSDLADLPFPLPPLAEQGRIVEKVEALLARVNASRDRLQRASAILKRFRQAVLAAACSGRLTADWREENSDVEPAGELLTRIRSLVLERASGGRERNTVSAFQDWSLAADPDIPEELPDTWRVCHIGDVGLVTNGSTPSRKRADYWQGSIPWVSSGEVHNNIIRATREGITEAGYRSCSVRLLPEGTVLLAMIGEGRTRGQSAILCMPATINQNIAAIVVPDRLVLSAYLWYWFRSRYEATREAGAGSGPQALNCQRVREIPLSLPPLSEQQEIVRRVDALFALADTIEQRVAAAGARAERLTQAILTKAFRGELVPQDPSDEPASVLLERIRQEREDLVPERPSAARIRRKRVQGKAGQTT